MIQLIINEYVSGKSINMIASELRISKSTVWKYLKINGVKIRPKISGEKNPRRIFDDKEELEICNLYKKGKTLEEIGRMFNQKITLISRILKRNKVQTRINKETGKIGRYCSRYIGGRYKVKKGYVCLYLPDYKWCHKGGWIQEHRYIMQNHLNRKLKPTEHIHHINGMKDDNRIENLVIMAESKHNHLHNPKGMKCRNPFGRKGKI